MTVFQKLREKNKIISFIVKLQNTALYPALVAAICIISGTGNKSVYIPCACIITVLAVFAGLFSPDLKVFLVPAFLAYYAVGIDDPAGYFGNHYEKLPLFDSSSAIPFAICIIIIIAVLIYRLFADHIIKDMLMRRGMFFWGILIFDVALILGGLFSPQWTPSSLMFGLLIAATLTVAYPLFLAVLSRSGDVIAYACKTLVFMGYTIISQLAIVLLRLHADGKLIKTFQGVTFLNRPQIALSWGPATIIGAVLVLSMAAAMYLMRCRKYPVLSFISACLFWAFTILMDTRVAIIFGAIVIFIGCLLCCVNGRNKKTVRIISLIVVLLIIAGFILLMVRFPDTYHIMLDKVIEFLRLDFEGEGLKGLNIFFSGRLEIWKNGIEDFLSAPVFGVGFANGYKEQPSDNLFDNMYHNLLIQVIASLGIFGVIAFIFHLKNIAEATFRRFTVEKFLILLTPLSILIMSLVDNFFFYPNFILVYAVFLAAAEIALEERRKMRIDNVKIPDKSRKPRVVFTYVEAGKGHIVPTRTICDEFKKNYGDRCEVVESKFFTETGDPDMEKTEVLFRKAVQNQNRSPVLSFLCKLGNLLAGDTFALRVLLKMSISGRKTNPLAVKHVNELDADVIYTAHWSIPFYVNQLKTPHPYTICFCPDVYSNGAFNVDCNNFLISSDVGYEQVMRTRMYAGGNVTRIPFPMRPEAENYKGEEKKAECRAKLGIPGDEFVVVLCDGGYGMAKLEKTVNELLKATEPMTIIAMCGMNHELYLKLAEKQSQTPEHIRLIAVDFTDKVLEYIAAADVFAGKSGANAIAEPASLGVPIIVTKCITYIEKGIKNYYVRKIKGALYIPSAHVAARQIRKFAADRSLLEPLKKNLATSHRQSYDAKASADLIWQRVCEMYGYEN